MSLVLGQTAQAILRGALALLALTLCVPFISSTPIPDLYPEDELLKRFILSQRARVPQSVRTFPVSGQSCFVRFETFELTSCFLAHVPSLAIPPCLINLVGVPSFPTHYPITIVEYISEQKYLHITSLTPCARFHLGTC